MTSGRADVLLLPAQLLAIGRRVTVEEIVFVLMSLGTGCLLFAISQTLLRGFFKIFVLLNGVWGKEVFSAISIFCCRAFLAQALH